MNLFELILIAIGLSMDAFAVAICKGLSLKSFNIKDGIIVGLYFGLFQALMPLAGYLLGSQFAEHIMAFDHWIAFILLTFIGTRMIMGSWENENIETEDNPQESDPIAFPKMLPLAVATSIDALAVGISFAFLKVSIVPAVSAIGLITFAFSLAGVKIGGVFGVAFKSKAEMAGGIILVLMGIKILLEHLNLFFF